ncbi:MAG: FMN-binding glutamate synthase family protein, partial [Comamonadaceae bacterium]
MLDRLNRNYPVRYSVVLLCAFLSIVFLAAWLIAGVGGWAFLFFGSALALGIHDMRQNAHAVLRNYPL